MKAATGQARLAIDRTRCGGHGLCLAVLPAKLVADEWGYPVITAPEVSDANRSDVRRAVAVCPALALRIALE